MNLIGNSYHELDTFREGALVALGGPDHYIADGWVAGFKSSDPAAAAQACRATSSPPASLIGNLFEAVTTPTMELGAGDYLNFHYAHECYDLGGLYFGTPDAVALYLALQARCSVAPYTFTAIFLNGTLDRAYPVNFTIAAANVWQKFTATIPGDTEGAWPVYAAGPGAFLRVSAVGGSDYLGTAGEWNNGINVCVAAGASNTLLQSAASFEIADVALSTEPLAAKRGTLADLFQREQRHLVKSYEQGTPLGTATNTGAVSPGDVRFAVPQRIDPAVTLYSPRSGAPGMAFDYVNNVDVPATVLRTSERGFTWTASPAAGSVVNIGAHFFADARFGSLEGAGLT